MDVFSLITNILTCWGAVKTVIFNILNKVFYEELFVRLILHKNFYYMEYTRHVTIYPDGHSILIDSSIVKVLCPQKMSNISREITLKDTKPGVEFDDFNKMCKCDMKNRFSGKGFWILSDSYMNLSLVKDVSGTLKNDNKTLNLNFCIDDGIYQKNKKVANFTYSYSIPGLYPIEGGYVDEKSFPATGNPFSTSVSLSCPIKKLNFIVSFDKNINYTNSPKLEILKRELGTSSGNENHKLIGKKTFDFLPDIFYNKFNVSIKYPKKGYIYNADWEIKRL